MYVLTSDGVVVEGRLPCGEWQRGEHQARAAALCAPHCDGHGISTSLAWGGYGFKELKNVLECNDALTVVM